MPASQKGCNKLLRTVEKTISTYGMLEPKDSVLVGVSGGPDSIALLHVLLKLASRFSLRIGVAHLNHSLRQKDSDKDANSIYLVMFVKKMSINIRLKTSFPWKKRPDAFATPFLKVYQKQTGSTKLLSAITVMIMPSLF